MDIYNWLTVFDEKELVTFATEIMYLKLAHNELEATIRSWRESSYIGQSPSPGLLMLKQDLGDADANDYFNFVIKNKCWLNQLNKNELEVFITQLINCAELHGIGMDSIIEQRREGAYCY